MNINRISKIIPDIKLWLKEYKLDSIKLIIKILNKIILIFFCDKTILFFKIKKKIIK